uniref:Uncharacterized protein n=1 Tax=Candidatus Kentrum sp. SD TaxID=2126332 RepID=A0A451BJQ1_9GAMM|nr:MAG: hypothetical protein BECKSD772F_GA0070984_103128 [Candidatus Kentron sp. SD]VFK43872.1 MAG: hypothetical protein BECKSD772E_GA0070983_103028 [Candidatus Kentron sp. SD]VFK78519.1 MAG: hypothetical protein BECKSD772D_GA0070982_10171 [Candidatus Kentron sp. SD]
MTIRRLAVDLVTYPLVLPIGPGPLEVLPTKHLRIETWGFNHQCVLPLAGTDCKVSKIKSPLSA